MGLRPFRKSCVYEDKICKGDVTLFRYTDWLVHLEHHKALLREAEQERLARLVITTSSGRSVEKIMTLNHSNRSKSTEIVCCMSSSA